MENPPTMSQFADKVSCLEARDKYWQKENAKLREQLADVSGQRDSCIAVYEEQLSRMREQLELESRCRKQNLELARESLIKLEAAEAKLNELNEQEPWMHSCNALCQDGVELWVDSCPHCGKFRGAGAMGTVLPLCQCDWHRPILDHAVGMPSPAQIRCVELEQENAKLRAALQRISDIALGHPYAGVTCGEIAREALGEKESQS